MIRPTTPVLVILVAACGATEPAPTPSPSPKAPAEAPARSSATALPPDSPVDATLLEAVKTPTWQGTLTIEAEEPSSSTRDTCTGPAALVERDGGIEGVARCTFSGPLAHFGTTLGRVQVREGAEQGRFDATPSPVVAEGTAVWTPAGFTLRFGDELDVGDQRVVRYTGTIQAARTTTAGGG